MPRATRLARIALVVTSLAFALVAHGAHAARSKGCNVLSGGRLGQVMGEDGTEAAPAAAACASHCEAADQVQGAALALGFPFPISVADRFTPRLPAN